MHFVAAAAAACAADTHALSLPQPLRLWPLRLTCLALSSCVLNQNIIARHRHGLRVNAAGVYRPALHRPSGGLAVRQSHGSERNRK